jgi:predicted DNA-binding transcriptional regulator AlpA
MTSRQSPTALHTTAPVTDADVLFTEDRAATLLSVTRRTLQAWRMRGSGPLYVKISSRCVRYKRSELLSWIESRSRASTAERGP